MDVVVEKAKMLMNWRNWIGNVVKIIKEILPDAEVYVIGSVARNEHIGSSDLDLLIVSEKITDKLSERGKLIAEIELRSNLPLHHPVEFHLVKPQDKDWYLRRSQKFIRLV